MPNIQPRWDSAFQYAGPPPAESLGDKGKGKSKVPIRPDGFQAPAVLAQVTENLLILQPGGAMPVPRDQQGTGQQGIQVSNAQRHYETLKYYDRNFPDQASKGMVPRRPEGRVVASAEDARAMDMFQQEVSRRDPKGKRMAKGEFGAAVAPGKSPADDDVLYSKGHSVNVPLNKVIDRGYDFHTHSWNPNKRPSPNDDAFTNALTSKFPSLDDYMRASKATLKAEEKGLPPPKFMMMTEGNFYQYYGDRLGYDRVEKPSNPPQPEAGSSSK